VTFAAVNYGIHDQVDVSFAVPIHTSVEVRTSTWTSSIATLYAVLPAGDAGLQVTRPTFNFGVNYAF
jgi:hypothetical protein